MKTKGLLIVILSLATAAAGFWGGRELARRQALAATEQAARQHAAEVAALKGEAVGWADAITRQEGEDLLRAFTAGIAPSLQAERRESVELSAVSLLRVPGVAGIHVLRPDGKVVYSSDAKVSTTGEIGESGRWALANSELASRPAPRDGTLEIALPLTDNGQVLAVVWMEYAFAAIRDARRPANLAMAAANAPPGV